FHIGQETRAWFKAQRDLKLQAYAAQAEEFQAWRATHGVEAQHYDAMWSQGLPADFDQAMSAGTALEKASSRKHSGRAINVLAKLAPFLVGGSADLAESNCSPIKDAGSVQKSPQGSFTGRNINFGVREHAMAAICNGLALHGAWRPYCATFLQFADYMRPSIRLAALMGARSIFIFTHDSVFLGEDGPTHQPVEHIACLRMMPGLTVWRPGDGLETGMAWAWTAAYAQGPVALCLSRQNLPLIEYPAGFDKASIWKGGYVLHEDAAADLTLIATGGELGTAQEAVKLLAAKGLKARLVSMPSVCVFKSQDSDYRAQVLGSLPRVTFEAGSTGYWASVAGSDALAIGVDGFGLSGPAEDLAKHFGLTAPQVSERILAWAKSKTQARV
ncbi:MAG TPA: transketolase C-terminal domain-containing protein, partial [bacterium]|nr:transketolase C-terminal domain-containing protein [bacterium]